MFAERTERHQALAGLHVIARVDVPPRHDAVNLSDDVTVTKVELGLNQVTIGGFELGTVGSVCPYYDYSWGSLKLDEHYRL